MRTVGPRAVVYRNSLGELHREDGPAVIWEEGSVEYWLRNRLHRADGPAVIHADGRREYWIHGELILNEEELQKIMREHPR